jgi:hypothetical protein
MTPQEAKFAQYRLALSEGISSWLRFEHHAGREELFSERYLALPIAQILQHCVGGKVVAESDHPVLAPVAKGGRPPQLDFIVKDDADEVVLAVESKWAATSGVAIADVLWDCVRLELAADHYQCPAIFILAGTRAQVDRVLRSPSFSTKNSRMEPTFVLQLHQSGKRSVRVNSYKDAYIVPLHNVLRNYPGIAWPSELNCSTGTQVPQAASANSYTAVVWHIEPADKAKRRPFIVLSEAETKEKRRDAVDKVKERQKAAAKFAKTNAAPAKTPAVKKPRSVK